VLQPHAGAAAGEVGGVEPFRDDALELAGPSGGKQALAIGEPGGRLPATAGELERFEQLAALEIAAPAERLAVEMEQVERGERRRRRGGRTLDRGRTAGEQPAAQQPKSGVPSSARQTRSPSSSSASPRAASSASSGNSSVQSRPMRERRSTLPRSTRSWARIPSHFTSHAHSDVDAAPAGGVPVCASIGSTNRGHGSRAARRREREAADTSSGAYAGLGADCAGGGEPPRPRVLTGA
jgi:hypothetical protein